MALVYTIAVHASAVSKSLLDMLHFFLYGTQQNELTQENIYVPKSDEAKNAPESIKKRAFRSASVMPKV